MLDDGTTSLLYTVSYYAANDGTAYYENAYLNVVGKSNSVGYGGANYIFKKKGYDTWSKVYKNVGDAIYLSVHTSPGYFNEVIIFYKE